MQELGARTGLAKGIVDADLLERRRALSAEHVGNGAAQPPITECSSTVTTWPVLAALLTIRSASMGLMVCMLMTSRRCPRSELLGSLESLANISRRR